MMVHRTSIQVVLLNFLAKNHFEGQKFFSCTLYYSNAEANIEKYQRQRRLLWEWMDCQQLRMERMRLRQKFRQK